MASGCCLRMKSYSCRSQNSLGSVMSPLVRYCTSNCRHRTISTGLNWMWTWLSNLFVIPNSFHLLANLAFKSYGRTPLIIRSVGRNLRPGSAECFGSVASIRRITSLYPPFYNSSFVWRFGCKSKGCGVTFWLRGRLCTKR